MISTTQDGVPSGERSLLFPLLSPFPWEAPGEADRLLPIALFRVLRSPLFSLLSPFLSEAPGEADRLPPVASFTVLDMFPNVA